MTVISKNSNLIRLEINEKDIQYCDPGSYIKCAVCNALERLGKYIPSATYDTITFSDQKGYDRYSYSIKDEELVMWFYIIANSHMIKDPKTWKYLTKEDIKPINIVFNREKLTVYFDNEHPETMGISSWIDTVKHWNDLDELYPEDLGL